MCCATPPSPLYQRCVRIGGAVPMQKKRRFCVDGFAAADTTLRWGGAGGGRRWRSLNTTGDVFFARDGPGVPILGCGIIRYINESTFASDHGHCLHTSQSVPSNKPHLIIQAAHPPCGSEVLQWCVKFLRGGVMSGLNGFWSFVYFWQCFSFLEPGPPEDNVPVRTLRCAC